MKTILALRKSLQVIVHSGSGQPLAFRVNIPQLVAWLSSVLIALSILGALSLLFFRELEINRKLETRLLAFETQKKLGQSSVSPELTANEASFSTKKLTAPAEEVSAANLTTEDQAASQQIAPPTNVVAKIGELNTLCNGEECQVRLSMNTVGAGVANGFLLIVMEAEVPRIGSNTSTEAQMRKRYFFYPEQEPRDDLGANEILKLEHRPFSFGRALKTSTSFKVGKLLRPLSVNAYLFDSKNALLQHERRAINEEP